MYQLSNMIWWQILMVWIKIEMEFGDFLVDAEDGYDDGGDAMLLRRMSMV